MWFSYTVIVIMREVFKIHVNWLLSLPDYKLNVKKTISAKNIKYSKNSTKNEKIPLSTLIAGFLVSYFLVILLPKNVLLGPYSYLLQRRSSIQDVVPQ